MKPREAAQKVLTVLAAMLAVAGVLVLLLPFDRAGIAAILLIPAAVGALLAKVIFRETPFYAVLESRRSPENR